MDKNTAIESEIAGYFVQITSGRRSISIATLGPKGTGLKIAAKKIWITRLWYPPL